MFFVLKGEVEFRFNDRTEKAVPGTMFHGAAFEGGRHEKEMAQKGFEPSSGRVPSWRSSA
jgi:hypothetical protein